MQLTGRIIAIMPAQTGVSNKTGQPWMSQEYVLQENDVEYQGRMLPGGKLVFEVWGQENIQKYNIQIGVEYRINFSTDARPNQEGTRWYGSNRAYRVECLHQSPYTSAPVYVHEGMSPNAQQAQAVQTAQQHGFQQVEQQYGKQASPFPPQQENLPFPR